MSIWFAAWALAAIVEITLYRLAKYPVFRHTVLRLLGASVVGAMMVCVDFMLLHRTGNYWLIPMVILPYRLLNLVRYARFRLEMRRLRSVSQKASGWLIVGQTLLAFFAWVLQGLGLETSLIVFSVVQLLVVGALLYVTTRTWHYALPKSLKASYTDSELPSLSVLIPARDETTALEACLRSLIANDYPKLEIIVLDDCSLDRRTPEIIKGFARDGVRFVQGKIPPDTWIAKNFAYAELLAEASGEVILYCGVDTTFEPSSLRMLIENMEAGGKEMLSVLPTRPETTERSLSILQTMRYYWELCLPRRVFKRPPVLSSCWLIRREALTKYGGFDGVSQSVSPEAHFARRAVVRNGYAFIRTHAELQVHSNKTSSEQFETAVRLRYPQLHRRLELVAAASLFELFFFIGPFAGLAACYWLPTQTSLLMLWVCSVLAIQFMYNLIAGQTKLNHSAIAFLVAPFGFAADIAMLHISLLRYEFGTVNWKGRNVCIPVMRVETRLPRIN